MNISQLYRELKRSGVSISYQALAAYKSFESVPRFEKASAILKYFDYQKTDDELSAILEYSREQLKEYKSSERKDIRQGIRLNPAYFSDNLTVDELDVMLTRRINELSDEEDHSMNSYISMLIKKDLTEQGYLS